jgi:hypothetical protein
MFREPDPCGGRGWVVMMNGGWAFMRSLLGGRGTRILIRGLESG